MYILTVIPAVLLLGQVRNLKYMVPFSMVANICMMIGFAITLYYVFTGIQLTGDVKLFASPEKLPTFFATVIFAIEGIGVVSTILPVSTHFGAVLKLPKCNFGDSLPPAGPFPQYKNL